MEKPRRHKWEKNPNGRLYEGVCVQCGLERTGVSNGRGPGRHFEHWVVVRGFGRRDGQLEKELRASPGECSGRPGYYDAYMAQRDADRQKMKRQVAVPGDVMRKEVGSHD